MAGYLLLEEKAFDHGFTPNPIRMGILDYMRELRQETFSFNREHRLRIVGLEDVLIAAGSDTSNRLKVSLFIRQVLASKANELESNVGWIQVVFRRPLRRADDFWFEIGRDNRVSLRPIFGSPMKQTNNGAEFYQVGFNLT